jgi:hypothetical protein
MGALRTLVVIEPGRAGDAAVEEARAQAAVVDCEVTLVGVARRDSSVRCGPSGEAYNAAITEAVARDLARARDRLVTAGVAVTCRVLVDGRDLPLEGFAAAEGFDLILLPSRGPRRAPRRHPAARRLTQLAGPEIRLVARP